MQNVVARKPMAVNLGETAIVALISTAGASAVTWLISSFTKASRKDVDEQIRQLRADWKEERQAQQIRLARLEERGEQFVTRAEFQKHVDDLKLDLRSMIGDIKAELLNLRRDGLK